MPSEVKRMRQLEDKNNRLKQIGAGLTLDKAMLQDVVRRKVWSDASLQGNPWRLAQTKSMQDDAAKRGWQLVYKDAAGSAAKQVADVNSMIAQQLRSSRITGMFAALAAMIAGIRMARASRR